MAEILLVEDNHDLATGVIALLEGEGYNVTHAVSAELALERWRWEHFSLLITDINLAGQMTGEQMCVIIRAELRSTMPIVVLSGHAEFAAADRRRATGVNAFVPKPFDIGELLEAVRRFLPQRRRLAAIA